MVNGINGNTTNNWFQLFNSSQKKSATSSNSTGSVDSAEIGGIPFGSSEMGQRQDPLEALVNDGTITNDQASAIHDALRAAMQSGQGPDSGIDPLASLVSAGTITQDQADSVKSVLEANRPGQDAGNFMSGVLDNLVKDGTITQDQEESIKQAMMQGYHHHHQASTVQDTSGSSGDSMLTASTTEAAGSAAHASPLDSLVSSGVITQDQEDAIRSAFQQAMETRRAMSAYSAGSSQYAGISV